MTCTRSIKRSRPDRVILFLAYLSGRPYNNQEETQIMWQVEVDKDKCNGDEECVNA